MRLNINSPLAPCALPDSGQLTPFQAIGLVADLAMNHSDYCDLSVSDLIDRLIPALNTGNAKVFFDDASRPYGYASWTTVSDDTHYSIMADNGQPHFGATQFFDTPSGSNLWFFDLLCPFAGPLPMYRILRQILNNHENAYLAPKTQSCAIRRIW